MNVSVAAAAVVAGGDAAAMFTDGFVAVKRTRHRRVLVMPPLSLLSSCHYFSLSVNAAAHNNVASDCS